MCEIISSVEVNEKVPGYDTLKSVSSARLWIFHVTELQSAGNIEDRVGSVTVTEV